MDAKLVENLKNLLDTLNGIEVSGKNNIVRLLASIQYIEKLMNGEFGTYVQKDEPES